MWILSLKVQLWFLWSSFFCFVVPSGGKRIVFIEHSFMVYHTHRSDVPLDRGHCTQVRVDSLQLMISVMKDHSAESNQMILTTGKYLWAEKSNSGSTWWGRHLVTLTKTAQYGAATLNYIHRNEIYSRECDHYVTLVSFLWPPARSFMTTMLGLATFSIRFTCYQSLSGYW